MNLYEEELPPVIKTFKGSCAGIVLYQRGPDDKHICFAPLVEDDDNWFLSKNGYSTAWFGDFWVQMEAAYNWMDSDESVRHTKYGYELK
jgi:hypothetical protein